MQGMPCTLHLSANWAQMPLPPPMVELELLIVFSSTFYSAGLTSILVNLLPSSSSPSPLLPPHSSSSVFLPSSSSPLLVHHSAGLSVHGEVPLSEKRGQLLGHSQVCLIGQLLQAKRSRESHVLCVCRRGDRGRGCICGV